MKRRKNKEKGSKGERRKNRRKKAKNKEEREEKGLTLPYSRAIIPDRLCTNRSATALQRCNSAH